MGFMYVFSKEFMSMLVIDAGPSSKCTYLFQPQAKAVPTATNIVPLKIVIIPDRCYSGPHATDFEHHVSSQQKLIDINN